MKVVSLIVFTIVFFGGVLLGYVLRGLDSSPRQLPLFMVDLTRTDGVKISLPINEENSKFFFLPKGVGLSNINLRHPNEQ